MRTPLRVKTIPLMIAAAVLTTTLTSAASAQAACGLRTSLLKQLQGKYKEVPVSMGLASNGSVVEITRSETGTWTILLTNPAGVTCLMAAGEHWENITPKQAEYNPS